ncbi:aldo/keto reductase [Taibaiella sp. KBW10]|uniref:aldo/keto reductase n=1 Tax=Taibaiella sp. KBW10 TaxID=2153357 RepID=UPI000F5A8DA6|nr:aldo/keto reductase [Taibaiella sp. KBW10]RQO30766.1 aldo/keto reductase [Taibaiella sp. KBW10]
MEVTLHNGVKMPMLGLGVWKTSEGQEVEDAVAFALEQGYRHIDTASFYKNETGVGHAIRNSSVASEEIFVTTKVWNEDQGYAATFKAYESSLSLLGLDYVDLYLVHWPVKGLFKETWRALEDLYQAGRVKAIGVSNFLQHHLEALLPDARIVPMVNQLEHHPYLVQASLQGFCKAHQIQFEAWSPLMQGRIFEIERLKQLSEKYRKTIAQIVLRWNIQNGIVTIPKSVSPRRILENSQIFDFDLSPEDMQAINQLDRQERIGPDPDVFC